MDSTQGIPFLLSKNLESKLKGLRLSNAPLSARTALILQEFCNLLGLMHAGGRITVDLGQGEEPRDPYLKISEVEVWDNRTSIGRPPSFSMARNPMLFSPQVLGILDTHMALQPGRLPSYGYFIHAAIDFISELAAVVDENGGKIFVHPPDTDKKLYHPLLEKDENVGAQSEVDTADMLARVLKAGKGGGTKSNPVP